MTKLERIQILRDLYPDNPVMVDKLSKRIMLARTESEAIRVMIDARHICEKGAAV